MSWDVQVLGQNSKGWFFVLSSVQICGVSWLVKVQALELSMHFVSFVFFGKCIGLANDYLAFCKHIFGETLFKVVPPPML